MTTAYPGGLTWLEYTKRLHILGSAQNIHQDLERGGKLDMLGKGPFVCRMKSSPHPFWKEVNPNGHVKGVMTALHRDDQFTNDMSLT